MTEKQLWIYQIRGLAIIAVVVCHQHGVLHESEFIQLLTLYSVTTLVFLMGVTKAISLKKHYSSNIVPEKILLYSLKAMAPVLCSYIITVFVYMSTNSGTEWTGVSYNEVGVSILNFSGVFYFIKYYVLLSLWGPFLYSIIKYFILKKNLMKIKVLQEIGVFLLIWVIGYISVGKTEVFGESYLFVYSLGLLVGQVKRPSVKKIFIPAFILLIVGFISAKRFYWARVSGNYNYSGGVNIFASKLQLNPPNISIILYSFGVIAVAYIFFEICNNSKILFFRLIGGLFSILGKYSMDIFMWHILIQNYLNYYFSLMEKNVKKNIIYYSAMLIIPIFARYVYCKVKEKVYNVLACE